MNKKLDVNHCTYSSLAPVKPKKNLRSVLGKYAQRSRGEYSLKHVLQANARHLGWFVFFQKTTLQPGLNSYSGARSIWLRLTSSSSLVTLFYFWSSTTWEERKKGFATRKNNCMSLRQTASNPLLLLFHYLCFSPIIFSSRIK